MSRRPSRHSTVPVGKPPRRARTPPPPRTSHALLPKSALRRGSPHRDVARIIDQAEHSLVDVIDNLLNSGVVLNAEVILALADVDLVYLRLSALLCAADRVSPLRKTP